MIFPLALILLFTFSATLFCQSLPPFALRTSVTVDNGLAQSSVSSIIQDNSGCLWLGTQKGVSKWNGKKITNFTKENGLIENNVRSLFCTLNGDIVIGTFSGVSVYGKYGMTTLSDPERKLLDKIYAIYETRDGRLFFGTEKNGVVILKNGKFTYLNKETGLVSNSIVAIIEDDEGSILLGYRSKGISILKAGNISNANKSDGITGDEIISFLRDNDGSILITTNAGICRYSKGRFSRIIHDERLSFRRGKNSFLSGAGTPYFVSTNSLHQLINGNFLKTIPLEESAHVVFTCLLISENGTLFVGTDGQGLKVYKRPFVYTLNNDPRLIHQNIFGISEDTRGNFYFTTLGSGIAVYNGKDKIQMLTKSDGLVSNSFYRVLSTENDRTYFASASDGLSVLSYGKISTPSIFRVFNNRRISVIYEALDSSLYFCPSLSVWRLKNDVLTDIGETIGLENNKIAAVCNARDGSLYFAVDALGLVRVRSGERMVYTKDNGLTDYDFFSLVEGRDGTLYIGTGAGLFLLRNNRFSSFNKKSGLSDNTIYSIAEDNAGRIYVATNNGINILDVSLENPSIRRIGKEDGFTSNEFNERAVYKDSQGRIWFGTVQGISCYYPSLDQPQRGKPYVRISSFISSGDNYDLEKIIEIDELTSHIQIEYEGIDIDSPEKITYLYRLKGYTNDWTCTASHSLNFDHLPSGSYTFELLSQNGWSVRSDVVSIDFVVLNPWWKRSRTVLFFLIVAAGFAVYYGFVFRRKQRGEPLTNKEFSFHTLTTRENEIIRYLLEGESYKSIAEKLFISPATVQTHIKNAYKKLHIHSKYDLFDAVRKDDKNSTDTKTLV